MFVKGTEINTFRIISGESSSERYAAKELEAYLTRMGLTVGGEFVFNLKIDADVIGNDSYRITVADDGITICGGNGRGIVYGVYGFLEKYAGVRYFTPDLEVLGNADFAVDEDYTYQSVFELRQQSWHNAFHSQDWCVKNGVNRVNSMKFSEEVGGSWNYGDYFVHTFYKLTETPHTTQPCLSDPEILKKAITNVRAVLKANPDMTIISVSQNDGNFDYCKCEKCAAIDAEEGSQAGTILRFVNAIADDIAEDYPHVVVDTLAYQYSVKPPKITKPRPNVCIRFCTYFNCHSHPYISEHCETGKEMVRNVEGWNAICDRIYVWDYSTNFSYFVSPFPSFLTLRKNMRFFAEHGVKGMYPQGNHQSVSGEFGELHCYLLAKLMQRPLMTEEEYQCHINEFLAAYYGAGWQNIRQYIDWTCQAVQDVHMRIDMAPQCVISKEKWLAGEEQIDAWWNEAERLAGDRLAAVQRSKLQWRFMKLYIHPDKEEALKFIADVKAAGIVWSECMKIKDDADFSKSPEEWFVRMW